MKGKAVQGKYSAFDTALYYLSFKDRTIKELSDKLNEKGYSEEDISIAIDKLLYYEYLNDKSYALSYIKGNIKKKGIKLITNELMSKGIAKQDILDALDELEVFDLDEGSIVRDIFDRRFTDVDMSDQKQRRRVIAYFLRRGFSYEAVNCLR